MSISPENQFLMQACLDYIHRCFGEGSEMAKKVTPDFPIGGKRIVRDPSGFMPGGFYYALTQPNVDLETEALAKVVPEGIVTADGKLIELDVIVWATGMTLDWLSTIEVIGRDGRKLSDVWAGNNPRTYLGGTVPGFPNLFVNDGPNTGLGHGGGHNFMTETVNHFAFECLQLLVENGAKSIEVTQEAHDSHNGRLDERMKGSIWTHEFKAHTYYRNDAGRPILPSPWRLVEYWHLSQRPEPSKFLLDSRPASAAAKTRVAEPAPAAE
jgi:cation diffusion facilitator CzcD-associated flavoprotein CzcO